ncbi:MAG: 16S rRNA (cytosine(1402)-N(4))-methyltransferase RsmH [Limnochordia bacterium]|nr:16S rRNA (cytosine(1402)-N(4))-methyltransferase RsmH [Limnochordia bacterium]
MADAEGVTLKGYEHKPVMLDETIKLLHIERESQGWFIDCTLGRGGHTEAVLKGSALRVIGVDQDEQALRETKKQLASFEERIHYLHGNFKDLSRLVEESVPDFPGAFGVLMDIGVSSPQLDDPTRGFSYHHDAPLDMRMDVTASVSAFDLVNDLSVEELTRIIRLYGEEKWAGRIAQFIDERRKKAPIVTTGELVEIIKAAIPARARRSGPHPARRTFQALRIAVNDELGSLEQGIEAAFSLLISGGRLAVISFHSLEDRIVKNQFRRLVGGCQCPKDLPCICDRKEQARIITTRPVRPTTEEVEQNPRSRSANLRVIERI